MTILKNVIKNCHWLVNDNFSLYKEWVIAENCHWPVNDNFWCSSIWSWSKQRIIDLSFWLWTYHLWPNVIYHSQWQKFMDKTLKKMSLTMVNDKKIVIYWKWSILTIYIGIHATVLALQSSMKSKIRENRNCPKWHKHLYPLVWCAQHRFESARWSLRVHPFHSWGSGQWARHSFPYFSNLKLPLKGIRSTPPVYFTSVSILAKARTCDMNEVEASANAFFYKQSKWWVGIRGCS